MKSYRDATNWACDQLEGKIIDGELDFEEYTFAFAVADSSIAIELNIPDEGPPHYIIDNDEIVYSILTLAKENHEFFDLCVDICATNVLVGAELPATLRLFAHECLKGDITRPTPHHRERKKNWLAQCYLWTFTNDVVRGFGLELTRNDASPSYSACDAVAEALTVCGRETKYSEIKDLMVHSDKKRLRDEFEAQIRISGLSDDFVGEELRPDGSSTLEMLVRHTVREIRGTFPAKKEESPKLP